MAKKFRDLAKATMSPESIARSEAAYRKMAAEMPLHELRKARGLSQTVLAKTMDIAQSNVSMIEKRTDIYISTLRSHIEAMGGTLEIVASFPEGDVKITNFSGIDADNSEATA